MHRCLFPLLIWFALTALVACGAESSPAESTGGSAADVVNPSGSAGDATGANATPSDASGATSSDDTAVGRAEDAMEPAQDTGPEDAARSNPSDAESALSDAASAEDTFPSADNEEDAATADPSDAAAPQEGDATDTLEDASALEDTGGDDGASWSDDVAQGEGDGGDASDDAQEPGNEDTQGSTALSFRQLAPLSTARSTSNRPIFRVALPDTLEAAKLTVCAEVTCDTVLLSFETIEATASCPEPLPAGPVYWYAEGVADGEIVTEPTPVWQLHIPTHPAPHGTAWGSTFDLELDGLADVLVGACGLSGCTELVGLHLGSPEGPASEPTSTITDPNQAAYFGFSVSSAGDVNGDGLPDVIVGGGLGDSAHLFLNSPEGIMAEPVQSWFVPGSFFGFSVSSAGDVNGDGYGDVIVGSMLGFSAFVYHGSPEGPGEGPNAALSTGAFGFGVSVASAGDVNGDGYEDVIAGAANGQPPEVSIWHGGPEGLPAIPDLILTGEGTFGVSARSAGDINGDGYGDIVVGGTATFVIHLGGPDGVSADPAMFDTGPEGFGISVAGAGDVNGDGYGDVVVGGATRASVYLGAFGGLSPEPAVTFMGSSTSQFGDSVACLGDTNGDGFDDLGVGATNEDRAYVYLGSAEGVAEEGVITLSLPSPDEGEAAPEGYGFSVGHSAR